MLSDESALICRGGKVKKMHFNRFVHESEFSVNLHNLTGFRIENFQFSSNYSYFYLLDFSPVIHSWSDKNDKDTSSQRTLSHQRRTKTGLAGMLHFFFVTSILAVVGSRVASLVVLEFCLRGVSGWVTAGPVSVSKTCLILSRISCFCCFCCSVSLSFTSDIDVVMTLDIYHRRQFIMCFDSSISFVYMHLYSSGVQ